MDSYDLQKLHQLLKDFYNLTNIKICIYDSSEEELSYYPEKLSSFCSLLRSDKNMDLKCRECDKQAFAECKKTYMQHVYTCHAGLMECVSPIIYDGKIIGYVAVGQIKPPNANNFKYKDAPSDLKEKLNEEFSKLPTIALDKISSAMRIIDACTGYEYLKNIVNNPNSKIDARIAEFINENLDTDLSVSTICDQFHLFHSEIYAIFKEHFRTTPAEYIKERRYNKACELLAKTSLPVGKIARQCGIPDYNYFSKVFKKKYGISPRQYRKNQLSAEN